MPEQRPPVAAQGGWTQPARPGAPQGCSPGGAVVAADGAAPRLSGAGGPSGGGGGSASLADPGQRSEREREPRAPPLGRAGGTRWGGGFAAPSSPAAQGSAHPGPGTPPGRDEGLRWSGGAGCGGAGLLAARGWADLPRPQRAVIFPSGWFIRYDECRQEREPTIG